MESLHKRSEIRAYYRNDYARAAKQIYGSKGPVSEKSPLADTPNVCLASEWKTRRKEDGRIACTLRRLAGRGVLVTHNPDFAARTQRQLTLYLGKMAK